MGRRGVTGRQDRASLRRGGPARFGPFGRGIFAVQASPRADRLYMLGDSGRLNIWELAPDVKDGPIQARRTGLDGRLTDEYSGMTLRADGELLALKDPSGTVTLHDTAALSRVAAIIRPTEREAEARFSVMAFSPDGRTLAAGSPQGQIVLWSLADPRTPRLMYRLPGQRGPQASLVFDREGCHLASCAAFESMVEIWNLELLDRELASLSIDE